jgi:branched-chain amino acid transport system ATP-binding protein
MVKEVKDVLEEIGRAGTSILLVEHNFKMAISLAKRVFVMSKARIDFSGTTEELEANPKIREKYLEV